MASKRKGDPEPDNSFDQEEERGTSKRKTPEGQPESSEELSMLEARKAQLLEDLKLVEKQIFDLEEHYLEETFSYGNVVKGWDGFHTANVPKPHSSFSSSSRKRIPNGDRIFSASSLSSPVDPNAEVVSLN